MILPQLDPPQGRTNPRALHSPDGSLLLSPPQGLGIAVQVPIFNDETYVVGGERGSVAYVIGGQRGIVDYEDLA